MGAMLVGILTTFIMTPILIFLMVLYATLIGVLAYKLHMSVLWWALMALLFNYWAIVPFVIIALKIGLKKCHRCGKKTKNNTGACPHCGEKVKRTDDVKIVKKILLASAAIYACCIIFGGILSIEF